MRRYKILLIISFFLFLMNPLTVESACSSEKNNRDVCPQPQVNRPSAGEKFFDPTFGTEIIRVTDETDGNRNLHAYSYWSPFNVDSSRFIIKRGKEVYLYDLDTATNTVKKVKPIIVDFDWAWEGLIWSSKDPDVLYAVANVGSSLYRFNVVTEAVTVVKNFGSIFPGLYLRQISKSEDDDVFAFTLSQTSTWREVAIGAYKVSADKSYRHNPAAGVNEAQVDKSGRYVFGVWDPQTRGTLVWDLETGKKTTLDWAHPSQDHSPGHYDSGFGRIVGTDANAASNEGFSFTLRNLSDPKNYTKLVVSPDWFDSHITWRNNDENYAYVSNHGSRSKPLGSEITQIFLDGSGFRRLAHHHSVRNNYWDSPKIVADRLGKYLMFNSNWDGEGRTDIYIIIIPEALRTAPGLNSTAPPVSASPAPTPAPTAPTTPAVPPSVASPAPVPTVPVNGPINVARNKPVTFSGLEWTPGSSSRINDGKSKIVDSYWALKGDAHWVTIDLGEPVSISKIIVNPTGMSVPNVYYNSSWNIMYATETPDSFADFSNVQKIRGGGEKLGMGVSIVNGDPGSGIADSAYQEYEFTFDVVKARYVRFEVTTGDVDGDSNLDEIELWGTRMGSEGDSVKPSPPLGLVVSITE